MENIDNCGRNVKRFFLIIKKIIFDISLRLPDGGEGVHFG
jgi:hypothetical protein